jgi:hypothetical protein
VDFLISKAMNNQRDYLSVLHEVCDPPLRKWTGR